MVIYMNEVKIGLDFVNSRCDTEYTSPNEVINGANQLSEEIIDGKNVDFQFDSHIMALDLFRAGGVVRPLRSKSMIEASKIWLSRNEVI